MESKTNFEIHEQYKALEKTVALLKAKRNECKEFFAKANPTSVIAVGCGSSYELSQAVATSARIHLNVASIALAGGDLMLHVEKYRNLFEGSPILITVSRSGSTSEVIYSLRELKEKFPALKVVCIACTEDSEIAALSDMVIEMPWAFDCSVCQTRSITNLYAAAMLFIASAGDIDEVFDSYSLLADKGEDYLASMEDTIKEIGSMDFTSAVVLCDGEGSPVADEAALAFNEISYTPSMYKHLLDVRHGPVVLINEKTVVIAKLDIDGFEYQRDLITDIVKRGAVVVVVTDEKIEQIQGVKTNITFEQKLHPMATVAILLPVAQLMSYYRAVAIGVDPDQPEGLAPCIEL